VKSGKSLHEKNFVVVPSTPRDRSGDENRRYEPSLEEDIRRRIPQEGFRGTPEALARLYPPNPHYGQNDTSGIETTSGGENPSSDLADSLRNSGSGKATGEAWPAEQKAKWARRTRVYRRR
jgi:hypothetical protein